MKKYTYILLIFSFFLSEKSLSQTTKYQKSKGGSELGFSIGSFWIDGDVNSEILNSQSNVLHWRKGINNVWSIKLALQHGRAIGLDFMPTGNLEHIYPEIFSGYNDSNPYFFSYKTNYSSFEFSNLFELTNLAPEVYLKNWNVYFGIGAGIGNFSTALNLKDANGNVYQDLISQTGFNVTNDHNTISGRKAIKNSLRGIYDNSYETAGPKKSGGFRLGDETNVQAHLLFSLGLARKINNRLNIGLDYTLRMSSNDLLDAYDKNIDIMSEGKDYMHSASIVLGFNLSDLASKKPLYWQNQWRNYDAQLEDHIAKTDSLLMDDDNDGVFNSIDQQANSMSNCEVDQFGVTLDSDKDGVPNCIDPYPFLNEDELKKYIENAVKAEASLLENAGDNLSNSTTLNSDANSNSSHALNSNTINKDEVSKMILMQQLNTPIYFTNGDFTLSQDSKKHLLEVSKALKKYPELKIELMGYASQNGTTNANLKLSESRVRETKEFLTQVLQVNVASIVVKFFGEDNPIIIENTKENAFLNRRVELKIN